MEKSVFAGEGRVVENMNETENEAEFQGVAVIVYGNRRLHLESLT